MAPFLAKPENRTFVERLTFQVEPPGCKPPHAPDQMKPMPGAKP